MAHEADIGDLSLSALRLPPSPSGAANGGGGGGGGGTSSRSSTSYRPRPPSLSFAPRTDDSPARPVGPLRIPSSPSSSAISSPPLSTVLPLAPPLLRTQRTLSRSNSTPRSRSRRNPSHDLSTPPIAGPPSTAALERWVRAFVVVNFDLDVGPVIERTYPNRRWGLGVGENISFSSFPDTSLFAEGRVGWSFKLNDDLATDIKGKGRADRLGHSNGANGSEGVRAGEGGGKEDGRLWGFVLFVQKRDGSIKRGYFQKSLVILTPLPYPSLFSSLVAFLAPLYFAHGQPVLEQACREISAWPDPTPGLTLELPFLGETFTVQIPERHQASQLLRPPASVTSLADLPSLGQPLHAASGSIGSSPGSTLPDRSAASLQASNGRQRDCLGAGPQAQAPIGQKLAPPLVNGTARSASTSSRAPPPAALRTQAATAPPSPRNILASLPLAPPVPLFSTALLPSLWVIWECLILAEPLIVIAPDPKTCSEIIWWLRDFLRPLPPSGDLRPYFHIHDASFSLLVNTHQPPLGTVLGVTNPFFRTACAHWPNVLTVGERLEVSLPGLGKRPASSPAGKGEAKEGFKTKRKRVVGKDKALLKRWEHAVGTPQASSRELTDEVRFHFSHLTEKFLVPLNRYFGSLIPTDLSPDAQNRLPPLKPFMSTSFLASLKSHGHPLAFRSALLSGGQSEAAQGIAFYEAFLRSKYFGVWLAGRCEDAEEECQRRARSRGWSG